MTHKELISEMATCLNQTQNKLSEVLDATVAVVNEKLSENVRVSIQGFGVFETIKKLEHISVNPQTQQQHLVPPSIAAAFKPVSGTKEQVIEPEKMENTITLSKLVDLVAARTEISKQEAEYFLKSLFKTVETALSTNELVEIKDFGTFKLTPAKTHQNVDVDNGEKMEIPARNRINFSPATMLRELVNKPFEHFESVLLNQGVSLADIETEIEETETELEKTAQPTLPIEIEIKEIKVADPISVRAETCANRPVSVKIKPQKKKPDILIPILGGIAIALAGFFLYNGKQSDKK